MKPRHFLSFAFAFVLIANFAIAGAFDPRTSFGTPPGHDLDSAIKRASVEKKSYPGLEMKYFAEREETKKLLKDHFLLVLLDRDHKDVRPYLPSANTEKAWWVLIGADGKAIKSAEVYGNPDEGLKTVKELVELP